MLELGSSYVLLLTLVLVRTSGIVLIAPIFGTAEVSPTVRALLAFALTLLVAPTVAAAPPVTPRTLVDFGLLIAGEILIGIVLGLGVTILFAAFQLAGTIIGQLSGMSLGDVFNPGLDESIPLFGQALYLVSLAVYAILGGHRLLLEGLLDTFAVLPPGAASLPTELHVLLSDLLAECFVLGLRMAAPAIASLLLATVVLGLISRSLPQLNVFALGFGFNALVTFGIMSISFGGAAWLMQERLEPVIDAAVSAVVEPRTTNK
jgi:flagellar biosynthetic protein FliR